MQQPARPEAVVEAAHEVVGALALGRPERRGVPLRRLVVVDRDEGRLAAHGQAHVVGGKIGVDASPSASSAAQASSENGAVTRGFSAMRLTLMSKKKETVAGSTTPVIGAAER